MNLHKAAQFLELPHIISSSYYSLHTAPNPPHTAAADNAKAQKHWSRVVSRATPPDVAPAPTAILPDLAWFSVLPSRVPGDPPVASSNQIIDGPVPSSMMAYYKLFFCVMMRYGPSLWLAHAPFSLGVTCKLGKASSVFLHRHAVVRRQGRGPLCSVDSANVRLTWTRWPLASCLTQRPAPRNA